MYITHAQFITPKGCQGCSELRNNFDPEKYVDDQRWMNMRTQREKKNRDRMAQRRTMGRQMA